jgi:CBS domain containing-hemolysin-like protein
MIARSEVIAIEENITTEKLKKIIIDKRHTRFPVYKETLDNITGYINIKDILPLIIEDKTFTIKEILREALVIPTSMKIIKLLSSMKKEKNHLAMVVDEFGGVDGLITMEDIMEEIVGEIEDEYDEGNKDKYVLVNDSTMIASAKLSIEDLEKTFGVKLKSNKDDDYDTVGGAILAITHNIPKRGQIVKHPAGVILEIIDSDPRKINRVIIRKNTNNS